MPVKIESTIENSKLCTMLKSFSKKEISKFIQLVSSPYFNKKEICIKLINEIAKYHPTYEHIKLNRQYLYRLLFPKKKYNEVEFNSLLSALVKLAEQFITYQHVENNELMSTQIKLSEFSRRSLMKNALAIAKSYKEESENLIARSYHQMYYDFAIEEELDDIFGNDNTTPFEKSLAKKGQYLNSFYLYNSLRIYSEMILRERIVNIEYDKSFFDQVISFYKKYKPELFEFPSIKIYHLILQSLTKPNDDSVFEKLFDAIVFYHPKLQDEEVNNMLQHATNYCIRKVNSGNSEYLQSLFEVMKFQSENNLLVFDGTIHDRTVKNCVDVALRLKEYDWAENFIEKNAQFIRGEEREMIINYNLSNILYSRKDFKKALKTLAFVNIKEPLYNLGSKVLRLKIYFESNDIFGIESDLANFKSYLKRDRGLSQYQKDIHLKWITVLGKVKVLNEKKLDFTKQEFTTKIDQLIATVKKEKDLANKAWLIDFMKGLK